MKSSPRYISGYSPTHPDGDINVVVEIPSGTTEKWEVDKETEELKLQHIEGKPRLVRYIGYPGNYGMIPQTLLPKEKGGDGDPLDVLIIGPPVARGSVQKCKLIGILKLRDRDEQDDKLIAVMSDTELYDVSDIDELEAKFPGMTEIIKIWFTHYKGQNLLQSSGYGDLQEARRMLEAAIQAYQETEE